MSETLTETAPPADAPAPAAATTPPAATPAASWRDTLPDDLKAAPSLTKFADPAALAKSYTELEKKIGQKGVILPGEGATPEQVAEFHRALGVPEKPADYALAAPEGIPPEVWNGDTASAFQQQAHTLGLTPAQAKGLAEWYAKDAAATVERLAAGIGPDGRKMDDVLREEWGPQHDAKVKLAQNAMRHFGDDAAVAALEARVGGVALMRMMAKIGETIAEDRPRGMGGDAMPSGAMTPAEIRAEIGRLTAHEAGNPYHDKLHPAYRTTVDKVTDLYRKLEKANAA